MVTIAILLLLMSLGLSLGANASTYRLNRRIVGEMRDLIANTCKRDAFMSTASAELAAFVRALAKAAEHGQSVSRHLAQVAETLERRAEMLAGVPAETLQEAREQVHGRGPDA